MARRSGPISVKKLPLSHKGRDGVAEGWFASFHWDHFHGRKVTALWLLNTKNLRYLEPQISFASGHIRAQDRIHCSSPGWPLLGYNVFLSQESQYAAVCLPSSALPPCSYPPDLSSSWANVKLGNVNAADTRYVTNRGASKEKVCKDAALPPGVLWCSLLSASVLKEQEMVEIHKDLSHFYKHTPDLQMCLIWTFPEQARRPVQPQLVFLLCCPSCSDDWASPCILIHVKLIPWTGP